MPDWGMLRIGVESREPNTPPLVMVKPPPVISSIESLPSRPFLASAPSEPSISAKDFWSQSRTTGTISPVGVETAMPMS